MSKSLKEKPVTRNLPVILVISGIAFVTLCLYGGAAVVPENENPGGVKMGSTLGASESGEIMSGMVNDIPYYHCAGNGKHLVLLHGAHFTKEDWKTSGILESLCKSKGVAAFAMDLPVSAGHQELKTLLTSMQNNQLLTLPVVLVTPSASGKTITDWMTKGNVAQLPSYISKWIPVAAGSVSNLSDEDVGSLQDQISILAIYGSEDAMGKKVTQRLSSLAGAESLEIEGAGHPCYLDSPAVFVKAVLQTMNVST